MTLVFSDSARQDRQAITDYTIKHFGVEQARRLRDRFQTTLSLLARNPGLGVERPELDPPGHSFRYYAVVKRFVVVYQATADGIRVVRLLHGARHLAEELSRDAGGDV
jgi:plasmid stabilization system protein ParE